MVSDQLLNVPCHTETVTVRTLDVVLPVLQ
jgi:hypothetical protein